MAQAMADTTQIASVPKSTVVPRVAERPALAPDVQLAGELKETGFSARQWLLERNQHFLQVTELIYRIAEYADGHNTIEEIAEAASRAMDRRVSADQVRQILRSIFIPRGLIVTDGAAALPRGRNEARSALLVNMRVRMLPPRVVNAIADGLRVFYVPPCLALMVLGIGISHFWLYGVHGLSGPVHAALFTPGGLVIVLVLVIASALFHELGHAAALRYAGARTRGIGAGLYLVYPVFYTDVTESYRLGRWARVRTDLGGFYFHLIFAVGLVGLSFVLGNDLPLFAVLVIDALIIRQCLPFVRMDGYWVLADVTGLPDFFSLMGPFLRSLMPASRQRAGAGSLPRMKRWVKFVFLLYVCVVLPVLAFLFVMAVIGLPRMIAATADAIALQAYIVAGVSAPGDIPRALAAVVQMIFLALPLVGISYLLYSVGRRVCVPILLAGLRHHRIRWRFVTISAAATVAGLAGVAWAPQLNLERWTAPNTPPDGVVDFEVTRRDHVLTPVMYPETPPVGGPHAPSWQNCGFYAEQIIDEYGVHSMEHGAVWITYRPDLTGAQLESLEQLARKQTYVLVSAYPGLSAPVVASAWGRQLRLESADDPRLGQFVRAYRLGANAPERGGPCTGGVGRV